MRTEAFSSTLLAVFGLGGWEVVLMLVMVLFLFASGRLPGAANGDEAVDKMARGAAKEFVVFLAQGFGVGRIPFAPGTFGSLVGLLWFAVLVGSGDLWLYLTGTLIGLALSVPVCGAAEKILRQKDPGSVVFDEIAAMPVCFLPWVISEWMRHHQMPTPESFFGARTCLATAIIFALFRLFDILKPWPVRQSQRLPGGWGVTVDDLLAAIYVALLTLFFVG